ncbi:MAG TPA: hypothetical protein VGO70_09120 [Arsenicitalea sp.]|jgi:hypothetical protein|nr:hypothetical protein [Arsenicitalea sp.]
MAIGTRLFRTRSPDRDQETDEYRAVAVRSSVEKALRESQLELSGLEARIETALIGSITLMDNSGDYGERSAEDEHDIIENEQQAQRGRLRVMALRQQIDRYSQMLAILSDGR